MNVHSGVDRVDSIVRALRKLAEKEVLIGVPDSNAERDGNFSNATIAFISEFGSPAANIPPRPHFVPGILDAKDRIVAQMKKAALAALDGKQDKVDAALNAVGIIGQNAVKARITGGLTPPLKPTTVSAHLRARGLTAKQKAKRYDKYGDSAGEKPLILTGAYLNSITYVIRAKD